MASLVTNFLALLTPSSISVAPDYDGWQLRWKILVFRPALFKTEALLLAGVAVYLVVFFYGRTRNASKAHTWIVSHQSLLDAQFSLPLGKGKIGLTADGYSDFFLFSTGRRGVSALHSVLTLRPRHDLFQWALQIARTFIDLQYSPRDVVELDFTLAPGALPHDFVWAVVAKDELASIRSSRWDLTFTKTNENPTLPPYLSVMTEFADVTESILKSPASSPITSALSDPLIKPIFRSLSITDQPRTRPAAPLAPDARGKHIILTLALPSNNNKEIVNASRALVGAVFRLVDGLSQIVLRPETKMKLRRRREDVERTLREDAGREEKEGRELEAEEKKTAKKRAEEERVAKMSAAEQKKYLEKERKRTLRKSQGKVVRK